MAYTYSWSTAGPVGTDPVSAGANEIREGVKAALNERILSVVNDINADPWVFKALTLQTASATALAVGRQGATSPAFLVDAAAALSATGVKITAAAAAGGVAIAAISSGANENITLDAKGSGTITLGSVSTGALAFQGASSRFGVSGASYTTTIGGGGAVAAARVVLCNIDVNSNGSGANVGNGAFQIIRAGNGNTGWQIGLFVNTNAVLSSNLDLGFYNNDSATYGAALSTAGKLTLLGGLAATTGNFSSAVVCATTLTVSAGLASFTKTTAAQAVFAGWEEVSGAGANKGQILIGGLAASQGRIHYDDAGQTVLYIDNSYDAATSTGIKLRLRTAGSAVVALAVDGTGALALPAYGGGGGAVTVGAADSGGAGYRLLRVLN